MGWLIFFVILTMIGMELQKPNKGGSSVTIFKRGEAPESVERSLNNKPPAEDEEAARKENSSATNSDESEEVSGIAQSTSIFTWKDVNYVIPYGGGKKQLLKNVQGYVKPGRLTALMGASGAGLVISFRSTRIFMLTQSIGKPPF